jgi:glycosyltransferase involved in cell wall biosynthesis
MHSEEGPLMATPEITAIIPVFNDRPALERAIPESLKALSRITENFEVIVAEDGSSDGSAEFVRQYETKSTHVKLLHSDIRQGRGKALNRAIRNAQGSIVCYYDVDLATRMKHLPDLIDAIRKGADISTGSRLLPESDIRRTGGREIASRSYNFLVRHILGSRLFDHQCGFKAFNKARIIPVLPSIRSNHWFWDTELLVRAQRLGYTVHEFPVQWRAGKGTTVRIKDVFGMGSAILRLWWQIHVSKN